MSASVSLPAKLRWAVVRGFLGLIFSIYFCVSTIKTACRVCDSNGCGSLITNLTFWAWAVHCLYFSSQIELPHRVHAVMREYHCLLHALSLGLAFYVAVAVSVLFMYSPSFTQRHADAEHLPVAIVWFFSILAHYVPPLLHLIGTLPLATTPPHLTMHFSDIYVLKEELFIHYRPPTHYSHIPFIGRVSAIALGPALVLMAWSLMFSTDQVYAVSIPPAVTYSIAAVVLLIVPIAFARVLLRMSADAEHWLNKYEGATAVGNNFNQQLLQQPLYI